MECNCRELGLEFVCCEELGCPCEGDPSCCGPVEGERMTKDELVGSVPMVRRKIRLTWAWLNRESGIFTTQGLDGVSGPLPTSPFFYPDDFYNCTEKVLTSWFVDDWGWYPHHPLDEEWGPR